MYNDPAFHGPHQLRVRSDATGLMELCTVHQGVLGADDVRRGALADIDALLFACDDEVGDQVLSHHRGPARVQQYKYSSDKEMREDERLSRLELMCEMDAEQCEDDNLSIIGQLPAPMYI